MKYILLLAGLIFMFSCNSNSNSDSISTKESLLNLPAPPPEENVAGDAKEDNNQKSTVPDTRMLVKTGTISIRVDDLKVCRSKINTFIKQYNGYISSEGESTFGNNLQNDLELRVPTKFFDDMIADIEKLATYVENRQINVQDVTAEYVDVQARLNARKAVEQSYLDLLKKAQSIEDILKIQDQLGAVRGEIESMQGRLNILSNQVQFSTVHVVLIKTLPYSAEPGQSTGYKFVKALSEGWSGFVGFLIFTVYLWPFLLLTPVIWMVIRRYRRKKTKI